jgi:hypothetical protein
MAVQTFLGAIFNQVSRWQAEDRLEEELYRLLDSLKAPVPLRIGEAFAVRGNSRVNHFAPVRLQCLQRCDVVYTHQAAVAHDIRRKNSRQSPFDAWACQDALNSELE